MDPDLKQDGIFKGDLKNKIKMKRKILLLKIMCIAIFINAQTKIDSIQPDYSKDLNKIDNEILEIKKQLDEYIISNEDYLSKLPDYSIEISSKSSISDLEKLKSEINNKINILEKYLEESNIIITTDIDNVTSSLNVTNSQLDSANGKLTSQEEKITESQLSNDKTSMISLISLILGGLLIIALIIIYKLTSKNISSTKDEIKDILKLDNELKNILEKHTQLLEQNKGGNSEEETLKSVKMVADQIATMENNIYQMDPNTRGLNKIVKAIRNLKNNFQVMGYTIPVLLGLEFKEGDSIEVIAELPDESIEKDKKIITRIVTPRIDFKGEMIQRARIEIKYNI
jgi:hypothetical protein